MSKRTRGNEARQSRVCRKKVTYETPFDAGLKGIIHFMNHHQWLHPYECSICGKYHLTTILSKLNKEQVHQKGIVQV